jgi:hypothetical protein
VDIGQGNKDTAGWQPDESTREEDAIPLPIEKLQHILMGEKEYKESEE